jgi:hypothetical protein
MKNMITALSATLVCLFGVSAFAADQLIAHCEQTTDNNENGSKDTIYDVYKTDSKGYAVSFTGYSGEFPATSASLSADKKTLTVDVAPSFALTITKASGSSSISTAGEDGDTLTCTTYW